LAQAKFVDVTVSMNIVNWKWVYGLDFSLPSNIER